MQASGACTFRAPSKVRESMIMSPFRIKVERELIYLVGCFIFNESNFEEEEEEEKRKKELDQNQVNHAACRTCSKT